MARLLLRDLASATAYKVQVRAKNDIATSEWSQIFTIQTVGDTVAPAPITGLSWTSVGTAFKGTWNAVTTNADSTPLTDFAYYEVTIYSSAAPSTTAVYNVTETRFDLSFEQNLNAFGTPRASVTIEVRAVDRSANKSTVVSATASNPAPATPANLAAVATYDSIAVKWDRVADQDLKYYELYTNPTNSNSGGTLVYRGTDNTYNHTTVAYSTDVYFYVLAVDVFNTPSTASAAIGPFRPKSASTVDTTAPAAVTGVSAVSTATTEGPAATVTFNRNTETDVDFYTIRYSTSSTGPWQYVDVPQATSGATLSALIRGLVPNTSYYFGVAVQDFSANRTAFTNASTYPVTISGNTSAPAQVTGVASYEAFNALTVYWTENSEADVKWGAGTYEVQVDTVNTFNSGNLKTVNTGATSASISGMVSGQTAFIRVRARNSSGTYGSYSTTVSNAIGQPADDIPTNTLSADVLKANTAILSNLTINNDVPNGRTGSIQSSDYNGTNTGWKLSSTGFDVFTGTIRAAALQIQNSFNLLPPQYADFEFRTDFYVSGSTLAGTATGVSAISSTSVFNSQSLQFNANGTLYLGTSTTNYNTLLEPSCTYIFSYYARVNSGSATVTPSVTTNTPTTFNGSAQALTGTFTRYSFTFTTGAGDTACIPWFTASGAGVAQIDGIQIERQFGGLTTPSQWKPPGYTRIDGAIIRTGEIRSSALSTVGDTTQPAWSINTAGNAQLNDVIVRGKIVVGASGNGFNSSIALASWNYGGSGAQWSIFGDGTFSLKSGSSGSTVTLANTGLTGNDNTGTVYNSGRPAGETFALLSTGALYLSGTINAQAGLFTGDVQITSTGSLYAGNSSTSGKRLKLDSTAVKVYTAAATNLCENPQGQDVYSATNCKAWNDVGMNYQFSPSIGVGPGTNGSDSFALSHFTSNAFGFAAGSYTASVYVYCNVDCYTRLGIQGTNLYEGTLTLIPARTWTRVWVTATTSGTIDHFVLRPPTNSSGGNNYTITQKIWYAGFQLETAQADSLPTSLILKNMRDVTTSTNPSSGKDQHTRAANSVVASINNDGTGQMAGTIHQASIFDGIVLGGLYGNVLNDNYATSVSGGTTINDQYSWVFDGSGIHVVGSGPVAQAGQTAHNIYKTQLTVSQSSPGTVSGVTSQQWTTTLQSAQPAGWGGSFTPKLELKSYAMGYVVGTGAVFDNANKGYAYLYSPGYVKIEAFDYMQFLTDGASFKFEPTTNADDTGIEIGWTGANRVTAKSALIDFHSGTTTTDYDSRILATGGNGSSGGGTLNLKAATIKLNDDDISTWVSWTPTVTGLTGGAASGKYRYIGPNMLYVLVAITAGTLTTAGTAPTLSLPAGITADSFAAHPLRAMLNATALILAYAPNSGTTITVSAADADGTNFAVGQGYGNCRIEGIIPIA